MLRLIASFFRGCGCSCNSCRNGACYMCLNGRPH